MTHQITGDDVAIIHDHDALGAFTWKARTLDGDYEADGRDPLEAVCRLASRLRRELREAGF